MIEKKFDTSKLDRLNNPERLRLTPPDKIWEKLDLQEPRTAVDVGAGTGFFSIPFLEKMGSEAIIYALDISQIMVDWMTAHVVPVHQRIRPGLMGESSIPLEDNSVDLALLFYLYHELEDPRKMLREVRRILKPGGKAAILDWRAEAMPEGPPLEIRVTPKRIREDLESCGFRNILEDRSMEKHDLLIGQKS